MLGTGREPPGVGGRQLGDQEFEEDREFLPGGIGVGEDAREEGVDLHERLAGRCP